MQIKVPIFLSSATCLALGSLLNTEVANACPVVTPKKVCCCCCVLKPQPKPRPYVELGVAQAFDSQLDSDSFSVVDPNDRNTTLILKLMPQSRALPNYVLIGAGYTWSQLYPEMPVYMPYVSIGLEYQLTNLTDKKTPMNLNFEAFRGRRADQKNSITYYKFSQSSLLGTLKLDLYRWTYVMPYVKLGLGTSWNQVKPKGSFFIVPPSNLLVQITTPDSRNSAFSYSVGAGLDFTVNDNFWLSVGYQYNNFGRLSIGKPDLIIPSGSPQNMQQVAKLNAVLKPFHLSNFSTQSIQLTGYYLFA